MRTRRSLGLVGLACLLWVTGLVLGTARVLADSPEPVSGTISSDNGHFEPVFQDGSVVVFEHDDVHQLTGDIEGDWVEFGYLFLDLNTGEGFFMAEGTLIGGVLGKSGTATLRVQGEVRDFFVTDRGHFVITQGYGGLAGVHASGTYEYVVGVGGFYDGRAHFDDRR
jgi:hypothetical protein